MPRRRLRQLAVGLTVLPLLVALAGTGQATEDTEAPSAPPNLQVIELTLNRVTLDWDPSTDNVGVTLYRVFDGDRFLDYTTDTRYRLFNLLPGTGYDFRVRAVDAAGNLSEPSNAPVTTPPDTQAPTTPGNFRVTSQRSTLVVLSWNASADNDRLLEYSIDDGSEVHSVHPIRTSQGFRLPTNQVYTFTIRAHDRSGNVSGSAETTVFLENVPPSAPANLREIGMSDGYPVLGWDPAVDNSGEITRYNVVIDDGIDTVTTTDLSIRIADLLGNLPPDRRDHTFFVTATDPSGNTSAPSNTVVIPVDF